MGYPNSWMVFKGKSIYKSLYMDDLGTIIIVVRILLTIITIYITNNKTYYNDIPQRLRYYIRVTVVRILLLPFKLTAWP